MKTTRLLALTCAAICGFGPNAEAKIMVQAEVQPDEREVREGWIEAHEWGVQDFDWGKGHVLPENLPKFIHTADAPGIKVSAPVQVQMMARKPVLYFRSGFDSVKIDVDLGFRDARPYAWFPQATRYMVPPAVKKGMDRRGTCAPHEPWQLSWDNLELVKIQDGQPLKVPQAPAGHWIHQARAVNDAMLVRNTKGAEEHYLFYEGAYDRSPEIALLPGKKDDFRIVNASAWDLDNVVIIRRDSKKGIFGYTKVDRLSASAVQTNVIKCGVGEKTPQKEMLWTGKPITTFKDGDTMSRDLREWFRGGIEFKGDNGGATQLREGETKALLDIWQKELFESEGITIVYRQGLAHLNHLIPLRITAPKKTRVTLRRCGLVIVRNVDPKPIRELAAAIDRYCADEATAEDMALLKRRKSAVMNLVRAEIGLKTGDDSRQLHLQRLQALLSLN